MQINDYTMWSIDDMLSYYSSYPDLMKSVNTSYEALFLFFERNGLLTCQVSNFQGKVVKRFIKASEITETGLLLAKGSNSAVDRWLKSKGSSKTPPDMRILEKELNKVKTL